MVRVWMTMLVAGCLLASATPPAHAAGLRAGAGKADMTPRTGYYLGGWTRADRVAGGQHTRLHARAMVLERGSRKVALVAVDLFMVPGGLVQHLGERLRSLGLSEQTILMSATHTHSGPGGYANFPTLNTTAPSMETVTDPGSFARLLSPRPADAQLYTFLLGRIEAAIRRADEDLGPAAAGWGSTRILGLTENRSLEAHLANHGVLRGYGKGHVSEDPEGGALHTIDPGVEVLRVDKVRRRRDGTVRTPLGAWSTFANHGTVTKSSFEFYNGDHHASAMRVFEDRVRRAGRVPRRQEVVNVYGNASEGDMSAGLDRHGPAASDAVGRVEAAAMFRAWRGAGRRMTRRPRLDARWTRICFCGQEVEGGRVDDHSEVGLPFLTGSEEERGPLHDVTGHHYEGVRNPAATGPQAPKVAAPAGEVPNHVPLLAVRVGSRVIVSVPGEGTKEVGARIRAAVGSAVAGSPVERVVVSGLANEFVLYFTTPEEYDRQHYEGGNTHFGRLSSVLLTGELAELAGTLVRGEPAPPAAEFDPTNGVDPDAGRPYSDGADSASPLRQPAGSYERFERARFSWLGGPHGLDRPVDRAFVTAERRAGGRWVPADDDLGLSMLWSVGDDGVHEVAWEVPRDAPTGRHRLVVTGKRYRLVSRSFRVRPSTGLEVRAVRPAGDRVGISLLYPPAVRDLDLTHRPRRARLGTVRFRVGRRTVVVRAGGRRVASVRAPHGRPVRLEAGGARDRHGNRHAEPVELR